MSEQPPPPYRKEGEPEPRPPFGRRGVAVPVGILLGLLVLGLILWLNAALGFPGGGMLFIALFFLYLVGGALLAARPRTALLGAGLLIGIGAAVVVSAGVCVALISGIGRQA